VSRREFYVTVAANMPHGAGHWVVIAEDESEARRLAFAHCPDGRWSFMYQSIDEVHKLDRKCHGTIGGTRG
jgi:elongation factor P hydroxylase